MCGIRCRLVSVRLSACLSVTSRYCAKTAQRKITQTTPRDIAESPVYECQRLDEMQRASPRPKGAGAPNADAVVEDRQLSQLSTHLRCWPTPERQALCGRPSSAPVLDICPLPGHTPPVTNPRRGRRTRQLFSGSLRYLPLLYYYYYYYYYYNTRLMATFPGQPG